VSRLGNTSLTFEFEIYPENEDRLIGSATSLYVCVDPKTLKSTPVPDLLRKRVSEFEGL
jgi:acyl-CoA thioesterase FadM